MIWHLLLVLLCCFWPAMNALHAQSSQEWERAGDRMMREGDAVSAQICYHKALGSDTTQSLLNRKLGEAAMAAKDYPAAARAFQRSVQLAPDKDKARLSFLASVNAKQSGDYVSWEQGLRMAANTLKTQDDDLEQRITQELGSISQVHRLLKDTGLIAVWNAGIRINGEFAEISPFRAGDSLILFSTSTPLQAFSRTFSLEEQQFRIMEAELKALGIGAPREMSTRINADGYHNAHPVLSADGSRMYFTRCQPGIPQQGSCGLWVARNQRGKWGKPRPLEGLNMSGYNTTQPCLAYIQEQEVLYFASDRPGGQGGWDLWYSVLTRGRPGPAVNVGSPLNSPGNEWAPTTSDSAGGLWFSSDWHPGLGGYDLFFSKGGYNQWSMPVNSGIPVNSSADDLWYIPEQGGKPGLMVSNRLGSQHHAGETCCYDLYLHRKLKERLPAYRPDSLTLARQRAAEQLNALLPLNLYFDNDQPDPASLNDTTSSNYLDLLLRYINRQAVFEKAYSSGLTAGLALAARDSVSTFFMDEIRSAAEQWDSLLAFVEHQLQNGFSINLVLRAYASPLNTPEYNAALASRRAASVRNELRRWNNGRLLPYLDSGNALAVVEIPVGERTSAGSISDDPSDTRNSVYSPAASRERRVSILYGTVDGFTGLWGGAPTTISIFPTEKFPDQLEEGEREVVRLRLQNDGSTSFHCRAIYSGHPQTEAVISERRIAPGGQTDIFILLKGPMNLKDTRIRLSITGNLYQNPFGIMFPME